MCVKPRRCGTGARGGVHAHAVRGQPLGRAARPLVVAERREEVRAAAQLRELDRRDRPAAAGLLPRLRRVHDVAGRGQVRHARELDPLDVPDDGDPGHGGETVSDGARWAVSGSSRVAAAFHDATARDARPQLQLAHRGVAELGGQRLRRGQPDADPVADRR